MLRLLPLPVLLVGCLTAEPAPTAPDLDPRNVAETWRAVQPLGLLDLASDPDALLGEDPSCPYLLESEDSSIWTGGCVRGDGAWIEGQIQQFRSEGELWLVADRFTVVRPEGIELLLDGALVQTAAGSLIGLEASLLLCGVHTPCQDGLVGLDLRYGLRLEEDGQVADVAVRGVVGLDGSEPASVDGAWRVDPLICDREPVDGLLAMQADQRQAIELDGADACDGCVAWTVQGTAAASWCPASL